MYYSKSKGFVSSMPLYVFTHLGRPMMCPKNSSLASNRCHFACHTQQPKLHDPRTNLSYHSGARCRYLQYKRTSKKKYLPAFGIVHNQYTMLISNYFQATFTCPAIETINVESQLMLLIQPCRRQKGNLSIQVDDHPKILQFYQT